MRHKLILACGFAAALLWIEAGGNQALGLTFEVSTDRDTYYRGQPIRVSITAFNPDPYDVTLHFSSSMQAQYSMDGSFTYPQMAFQMFTEQGIPAEGSYTWTYVHSWDHYDLAFGSHSAAGRVVGYSGWRSSSPPQFEVVRSPLPTEDVLIDFDHFPDGSESTGRRNLALDYAVWGVRFRSIADHNPPGVREVEGNLYAHDSSCTYPTGFNIVADFDMPVYGVSAEVSAAAGRTVTMIAKDADGATIGSVESDPMPAPFTLVGPLELTTDAPIAWVEWWPSETNSGIGIDNLYVDVPEGYLLSDLSGNGFVDDDDLSLLLANWDNGAYWAHGDLNADDMVDNEDLSLLLASWGDRLPPAPPGGEAVPEPASALILLLGFHCVARRRMRR